MSNPFEPTDVQGNPLEPGTFDVATAVLDALRGVQRNALTLIGATFLALILYYVSICTLIGWIVILPLLLFGVVKLVLEAVRGNTQVSTLWSGKDEFGRAFMSMWGFILLYVVCSIPVMVIMMGVMWPTLSASMSGGSTNPMDTVTMTATMTVVGLLWGFILVRIQLAPFYIVDKAAGATDALTSSWKRTQGNWGRLIALQLLLFLFTTPGNVISTATSYHQQGLSPSDMVDFMPIQLAVTMVVMVLNILLGMVGYAAFASAYDQIERPID